MPDTDRTPVPDPARAARADAEGVHGQIRKLVPSDRSIFLDHLMRLDPLSRFMRFGGVIADSAIARHAARALGGDANLIGYFIDGELRAVAELHPLPLRAGKPAAAEAAFSVERPWQGKGIGSALMSHLVLLAQNRAIKELAVVFLPNNGPMRRLAVQHAADFSLDADEVVGRMQAPRATPFSWTREFVGDVFAVLTSAAEIQQRMLPPPVRGT